MFIEYGYHTQAPTRRHVIERLDPLFFEKALDFLGYFIPPSASYNRHRRNGKLVP